MLELKIKQILQVLRALTVNQFFRWGRTHKIKKRFFGTIADVRWDGPNKRRGGAFVFDCDYKNMKSQSHRVVLKAMLDDYSGHLRILASQEAFPPNKRRKAYKECKNTAINSSLDFELYLDNGWLNLGTFFPSNVRELRDQHVKVWLAKYASRNLSPAKSLLMSVAEFEKNQQNLQDDFDDLQEESQRLFNKKIMMNCFESAAEDMFTTDTGSKKKQPILPQESVDTLVCRQMDALILQMQKRGISRRDIVQMFFRAKHETEAKGFIWV
jgi:hypothetical protein